MTELHHGPLNKNFYTQYLELITRYMIYVPNKTSFHYQNNHESKKELHANLDGLAVNLSQLFNKTNFSHLQLNQYDSKKYMNHGIRPTRWLLQKLFGEPAKPAVHITNNFELTLAEKSSITSYTGSAYIDMNNLLYKKETLYPESTVLKVILTGSGLNKIMRNPSTNMTSYRRESYAPEEEIQTRINLIQQGGGYTEQPAFMSTTTRLVYAPKSTIIFDSVYGKSIEKLSYFPSEKEFLLPPGQIFWKTYELKDGCHVFHADAIAPLIAGKDTPSEQEIADFNKLIDLSMNKGVPVFLTQHLQENVLKRIVPTPVKPAKPVVQGLLPLKSKLWLTAIFGLLLISVGIFFIPYALNMDPVFLLLDFNVMLAGIISVKASITLFAKLRSKTVNAQPAPTLSPTNNQPTLMQQIKAQLEDEKNAVNALENSLSQRSRSSKQFINKLHEILGFDKSNQSEQRNAKDQEKKLVLLRYIHKLEEKVIAANPRDAAKVQRAVLIEATKSELALL